MKISIVIPSYQQAEYLRECLLSVISASSGSTEIIVIDGGSTDGSVNVIKEFESKIAYWVSEPDAGQADAINKGLSRVTGDVWSFLNSDDLLEPGSLETVASFFRQRHSANWLAGSCRVFAEDAEDWILTPRGFESTFDLLAPWSREKPYVFPQSGACFMRKCVVEKIGQFDPSYHYSMDIEYYTRAMLKGEFEQNLTSECLAAWRWHPEAKSFKKGIAYAFREDEIRIAQSYLSYLPESDQRPMRHQIDSQLRELDLRKAMWNYRESNLEQARYYLFRCLWESPTSIFHRPWLGAARRILLGGRRSKQD